MWKRILFQLHLREGRHLLFLLFGGSSWSFGFCLWLESLVIVLRLLLIGLREDARWREVIDSVVASRLSASKVLTVEEVSVLRLRRIVEGRGSARRQQHDVLLANKLEEQVIGPIKVQRRRHPAVTQPEAGELQFLANESQRPVKRQCCALCT